MRYVHNFFQLRQYTVDHIKALEPPFSEDGFGEFIFYRTYSRNIAGYQETWADCVIRVINGVFSIRKDWYLRNHISWDEKSWQKVAAKMALSMFYMEWLPPGRGLWAMGTDFIYDRGGMALYNCAYTDLDENLEDDLAWAMDSLMLGVGVGFGPTRTDHMIFKHPKGSYEFIIPDTREGWVESYRLKYLAHKTGGPMPRYIYDEIREKGLPINGFGGLASGPEPLKILHQQLDEAIDRYMTDKYYDSITLKADLANQIGCCVVAGNVRRSAELLKGKMDDRVFKDLKNYKKHPERENWGWMSNNSVILEDDIDFEALPEIAERIKVNGEPGFLNLRNFPKGRIGKRDGLRRDRAKGINPCQPAWAKVLTLGGIRELKEINIGDLIWSETGWTKVINKWSTGIKKVFKYQTTAGVFYGTENHEIVSEGMKIPVGVASSIDTLVGLAYDDLIGMGKLEIEDEDIIDGLVIGDGTNHHGIILLNIGENDQDTLNKYYLYIHESYSKDYQYKVISSITVPELPNTYERRVPERFLKGTVTKVAGFLRGLYSANGSICGNRVTLKTASKGLMEDVQMMLSSLGIRSYFTTNKSSEVLFENGPYVCKESYDLNITEGKHIFAKSIGFIQDYKTEKLNEILSIRGRYKETFEIISVEYLGEEEVFDITVNNCFHTFWSQCCNVSNCGEITLEHREVCNVDETLPTVCEHADDWLVACRYATLYATTVSLLPTHQPSTNKVVARNRRIGVSIIDFTGWMERDGLTQVTKYLRLGYKQIRKSARHYASEAGVPEPIKVTTIKPGGTVPKLPGKTSGAGYPNFNIMIRRVRVAQNSPVHPILAAANVPYEPDIRSMGTDVFEFPYKNEGAPQAEEISIWQQAMNIVLLQSNWADNAVSNTLNYRPKWKLNKVFSVDYGELEPFEQAKNWLLVHTDSIESYHDFIDKLMTFSEDVYNSKIRVTIKYDKNDNVKEVSLYTFDPKHEEDQLEPVLAAIAPLTKSVAVLPHSAKGAYPQMPEEGITEQEYQFRKSNITKIDWSILRNSDGQDERYCQGDKCDLPIQE